MIWRGLWCRHYFEDRHQLCSAFVAIEPKIDLLGNVYYTIPEGWECQHADVKGSIDLQNVRCPAHRIIAAPPMVPPSEIEILRQRIRELEAELEVEKMTS